MKQLIICSSSDLHHLHGVVAGITLDTTLLMSSGNLNKSSLSIMATSKVTLNMTYKCDDSASRLEMLQELVNLERAYFAVTPAVVSSTAYQAMVYSLYPRLLQVDCWKITTETITIPRGLAFLRHLPEGKPV